MATSLPTPGQLIVDNVTLLAGSPTAFNERYGHHLTPTTFSKPGNHGPANCLLHFLISLIDPDLTEPLFKPCFPILDRDQERDFRRVVDSRLAILEKTKLLPSGSARKSVIASGGGDRFLDLVWNLSTLAIQQACIHHPAYGSSSRLRMVSSHTQSHHSHSHSHHHHHHHNSRSDVLSHQSSARSNRSLFSVVSTRSERPADSHQQHQHQQHLPSSSASSVASATLSVSRQRRFLGVGMLSASEQRARDAENARARIDAERMALQRTVNVGKEGATTWASEADSLREKIGQFEAKLARLKGQLADMGFDENGVDLRGKNQRAQLSARPPTPPSKSATLSDDSPPLPQPPLPPSLPPQTSPSVSTTPAKTLACLTPNVVVVGSENIPTPITSASELRPSPSGDDLEHFKTSPFDSTESGSSVDDLQERDLSSDLSRLLTFSVETASKRREVEESLKNAKSLENVSVVPHATEDNNTAANDIVNLVRAATTELQQATDRMDEIRRERARMSGDEVCDSASHHDLPSGPTADKSKSTGAVHGDEVSKNLSAVRTHGERSEERNISEGASSSPKVSEVLGDDVQAPLEQRASEAVKSHKEIIDASTKVRADAVRLSERSRDIIEEANPKASSSTSTKSSSPTIEGEKKWLTRSATELPPRHDSNNDDASSSSKSKKPNATMDAARDLNAASKALRTSAPTDRKTRADIANRRQNATRRSLDSINLSANSNKTVNISPRYDTNCSVNPSPSTSVSAIKNPRSVRFAELPPSYTRSRETERGPTSTRPARLATEVHPSARSGTHDILKTKEDENLQTTRNPKEKKRKTDEEKNVCSSKREAQKREATPASPSDSSRVNSAQKPPRLQRRQTPHRIVSQKDPSQRAVPSSSRKNAPPRPMSEPARSNTAVPSRMRVAQTERDVAAAPPSASPSREIQEKGSRSSSPKPRVGLPDTSPNRETLSGSTEGSPLTTSSSKDDITVNGRRSKSRVTRQRSDMSEPIPDKDRSAAATNFVSTPLAHLGKATLTDRDATPLVPEAEENVYKQSSTTTPEIPSVPDRQAEMETPNTSSSEHSPPSNGNVQITEGTEGSGSSGNITDSFVGKSDSSGSMIGSSEEWPGSQLSGGSAHKSGSSSPETPSKVSRSSRKHGLLRKSSGGMFGTFHVGKSRSSSLLKDGSAVAGSSGESVDSLVSAGRPPLPQKSGPQRASNGGFFAGETAQWQENVQRTNNNSTTDGGAVTNGGPRMSDETGVRGGRGNPAPRAASANPPARKSRVQSFRARLAALK